MNNQSVLLLIAIGVLIAVLFVVPSSENFGSEVPYVPLRKHLMTASNEEEHPNHNLLSITQEDAQKHISSEADIHPESSVDCTATPEAPACQSRSPPPAISTTLETCTPSDGVWSTPETGQSGRSTLKSPCCDPNTGYKLATNYKTCDDKLDPSNQIESCIQKCCANANAEANNYDSSWFPMARCACSLWCYNKDVIHFKKYGTAVHYITGDLAEAKTSDSGDFIGGSGHDFSGQ